MTSESWIVESLGVERVRRATTEAGRRRLRDALGIKGTGRADDDHLRFVTNALELRVAVLLDDGSPDELRSAAAEAFQIARVLPHEGTPTEAAQSLVRLGCLGVLGDRGADVKRLLVANGLPVLPLDAEDWGQRVWSTILEVWLRLLRKQGWDDLDAVQARVANLRASQRDHEPEFLEEAEQRQDAAPAWDLMTTYHLAKAAEILGAYLSQGTVDGRYDIREQLEAQFDRAVAAAAAGQLMERETFVYLLARTARTLIENSIWTVTRAVNSRVFRFVESMTSRSRRQPIFEMLPPQRRTLREQGLLGSGHRSVVVSLPTSSGKTFIAQFRILQALNQFDRERGWVAYLAPTRALVNQLTLRLRRDFADLGITVEKASPALEIDGLEADMLVDADAERQFRLLVTTPEKLDMMLRGDWEGRIGRPLTLVVVDEAHGLASGPRGLRLELLLATINRECRHAQFLLLTPFIPNADEIAQWLAPDSHQSIELGVDRTPNDRVCRHRKTPAGRSARRFRNRAASAAHESQHDRRSRAADARTTTTFGIVVVEGYTLTGFTRGGHGAGSAAARHGHRSRRPTKAYLERSRGFQGGRKPHCPKGVRIWITSSVSSATKWDRTSPWRRCWSTVLPCIMPGFPTTHGLSWSG